MTEKRFYVYRHIRLDTNTPFYVGKGTKRRAYTKNGRNDYWNNITKKTNFKVEIIKNNLTEQEAFDKEVYFIELYRKFGYCESNICDGGFAPPILCGKDNPFYGKKHTEESRRKMSEANKGKKVPREVIDRTNKTKEALLKTPEYREKMRQAGLKSAQKRMCKIIDQDGNIHNSIKEAAKANNCSRNKVSKIVRGITKKPYDRLTFKYYTGE